MMCDNDYDVLAAAMDRILPSDDGPGATTANAIGYARRMMLLDTFQSHVNTMRTGLKLLQDIAHARYEKDFCACNAGERDDVITAIMLVPHPTIEQFFAMLVRMTIAGFLCDPSHDGNLNRVGWHALACHPHRVSRQRD